MPEPWNRILRIVCLVLTGVIVFELFRFATRKDPLADLNIEPIALAPLSNSTSSVSSSTTASHVVVPATNFGTTSPSSNSAAGVSKTTNAAVTNSHLAVAGMPSPGAEIVAVSNASPSTNASRSNATVAAAASTNSAMTNISKVAPVRRGPSLSAPKASDLPPAIQERVDRIVQSEILAPVIRPLPMALLGIAGPDAFIRTPSGQMGLMREGDELGGVKLLRIGTNRVLIEHEQQQKELTVFAGFGGETLLPKGDKPQ